jgi:thermitase
LICHDNGSLNSGNESMDIDIYTTVELYFIQTLFSGEELMKKKITGICLCCMLLIVAFGPQAGGTTNKWQPYGDKSTTEFTPGEFIVKLKKNMTFSKTTLAALNEKHQVNTLEKVFPNAEGTILDNIFMLYVPLESDILSIVQDYARCPDVEYAEPNGRGVLCGIPNDANFSNQWYLHNTGQTGTPDCDIDAPEAWDIETGNPEVVIAIIDTGIDDTHPDLATKIWNNTDEIPNNGIDDDNNGYIDDVSGWDFYYNDNDPDDGYGHGTFCAGIAAASTNNNIGMAGVGWQCKFMPLKIISENGGFSDSATAASIKYAADNGADVISMSFTFLDSSLLEDAVNYAYEKEVFLCAAAGNQNSSTEHYPAAYENVTAVAATTQNDTRCTPDEWGPGSGSNYGDWVDIAAPGNVIYSTMPTYHVTMNDEGYGQNYTFASGTSAATPMVAGVAALLLSKNPLLSPDEVKTLMCENADPYNSTEYIGTGRLNAQKTLLASNQPPVADFYWTPQDPRTNQQIIFDASASYDPDGTIILYEWDWDNDSMYEENYTTSTATHSWEHEGSYPVTVRVTDDYNATGTITTLVNVNGTINFKIDITGGFGVTAVITNNGTLNATKIQWKVTLTGGLVILGRTKSGASIPIEPGAFVTIKDTPIIGLGKTTINVEVTCAEGVSVTQTKTGIVLLCFVLGVK